MPFGPVLELARVLAMPGISDQSLGAVHFLGQREEASAEGTSRVRLSDFSQVRLGQDDAPAFRGRLIQVLV